MWLGFFTTLKAKSILIEKGLIRVTKILFVLKIWSGLLQFITDPFCGLATHEATVHNK